MSDNKYSNGNNGEVNGSLSSIIQNMDKLRKGMEERLDAMEDKINKIYVRVYVVFCEKCEGPIKEPLCCIENTCCADCYDTIRCGTCRTIVCKQCSYTHSGLYDPEISYYCKACSDEIEAARL